MNTLSYDYLADLKILLDNFPHDRFAEMVQVILNAYHNQKHIFVMGNGGSATTASHWVCDINKGCSLNREKKFRMVCLNDSISTMLAYANDMAYEDVFLEQLKNYFEKGDVVIGISGSGNSENVLKAIDYANANGGTTIGLCGFSGGKLAQKVNIPVRADCDDMQKIEDVHMITVHMSMQMIMHSLGEATCGCSTIKT